jgi:hypothetical protein
LRLQGKNKKVLDHEKINMLIMDMKVLTKKFCKLYEVYDGSFQRLKKLSQKGRAEGRYRMEIESSYKN